MIVLIVVLQLLRADFCPPLVELQVYDQVLEGVEISERDVLRIPKDQKLQPSEQKDFFKRDIDILKQSLSLRTVDKDEKQKAESLIAEFEKGLIEKGAQATEITRKNLKSYQKIIEKCRKPGNK